MAEKTKTNQANLGILAQSPNVVSTDATKQIPSFELEQKLENNGEYLFRGTFHHSIDDKGRVSIPSSFRQIMLAKKENEIVLTNYITDGMRCLDAFTISAWKKFETNLSRKSRFDPKLRKLENYYLSRAVVCSIDGSGRINIPSHLRVYASLDKEIVFVASLHGFRIWERKIWDVLFQEAEAALLENPALFEGVDFE